MYGAIEGIEAVGLWYQRRWAEYLTFLVTTSLLPLEIYEIVNHTTVFKILAFLINIAVVLYLLRAKRLFGVRGGAAADEAEAALDQGWECARAHRASDARPAESPPPHPTRQWVSIRVRASGSRGPLAGTAGAGRSSSPSSVWNATASIAALARGDRVAVDARRGSRHPGRARRSTARG